MTLYHLATHCEPSLWIGPLRPTQAQIDALLVDHYGDRARVTTLELHRDGRRVETVAHDDYGGPRDDMGDWRAECRTVNAEQARRGR